MNQIGQKIKKVRELRNFTQEYMAMELGLSQNGYSKIERGDTDLSVSRLEKIAQILKVNVFDLWEFDENKHFFNITHNQTGNRIAIYSSMTDNEKQLYESRITELKDTISTLKEMISILRDKT